MNNSHKIVLILVVFLLLAPAVLGANIADTLGNTLGQFKDIFEIYPKYYPIIDAILYFILFIGITSMALGEKFREHKSVPTVIGIMLAIGMLVFEYKSGFNLGKLAPIALLILILFIGTLVGKYAKELGSNTITAIALAFTIIIIVINLAAPAINEWINNITWLAAIKNIILLIAFATLIFMASKYLKGISTGENAFRRAERDTDYAEKKERKIREKEDNLAQRILKLDEESKQFSEKLQNLEYVEKQLEGVETMERKNQLQLLQQLEQALDGTWKFQEELRKIHNNINNPAYENEKDKIDGYFGMFEQYINKIKLLITTLQTHINFSKEKSDKKFNDIEIEFSNDIRKLLDDNIKLIEGLNKELEELKGSEIYPHLYSEFKQLREKAITNIRNEKEVKDSEKKIIKFQKSLRDADSKNLADINHAISVLEKDPLTKLNLANRTGRALTFGLFSENTLHTISDIVKQVRKKLEEIIAIENSADNGNNLTIEKNKKIENILSIQKNIDIEYGEFEKKVIKMTKDQDNAVNKMYIEKAAELLKIAETLRTEPGTDVGLKVKSINDANIAIATFQQSIKDSKYKDNKLIKPLIEDAQSLDKMCNNFQTKKDGKVNSKTQSLLKTFMTEMTLEIEKVKKDITTG